jgi:hypothetical protein
MAHCAAERRCRANAKVVAGSGGGGEGGEGLVDDGEALLGELQAVVGLELFDLAAALSSLPSPVLLPANDGQATVFALTLAWQRHCPYQCTAAIASYAGRAWRKTFWDILTHKRKGPIVNGYRLGAG